MIIYEDSSLIAINKPAGYSSQGGHKADFNIPHLGYNYVKGTFKIVHRLDQNVSGLMFVTKSRNFASYFGKLLEDKENLVKEYICVVKEIPKMKRALVDTPLRFDKNKNKTVLSSSLDKDSKSAKTEYECLNDS